MSYSTIEARVKTLLQAMSEFEDDDVTRGDYRVLDRGSRRCAVLEPGPFEREEYDAPGGWITRWLAYISVFEPYYEDGTTQTNLQSTRQAIVDEFDQYPSLNSLSVYIIWSGVISGDDPAEVFNVTGDGPFFLRQILTLRVHELSYATGGEYA